jgi:hypothetical protein
VTAPFGAKNFVTEFSRTNLPACGNDENRNYSIGLLKELTLENDYLRAENKVLRSNLGLIAFN